MGVLDGQVAIVTGAGRGIGRELAQALAEAGAAVAAVARTRPEVEAVADELQAAGGRAFAETCDVTERASVEAMVASVERELGPVDLLVNNAGTIGTFGPVWEVDPEQWWRANEINLRGPFLCARAVLPGMLERRRGRILNITSGAGIRPGPYTSAYACSKTALVRLSDTIAAETAEYGVAVFALSPGRVRTPLTHVMDTDPASKRWLKWYHDLGDTNWDGPEPVRRMVVFFASGAADALSGRYFHVHDDYEALVERADAIVREDLHGLRLRVEDYAALRGRRS